MLVLRLLSLFPAVQDAIVCNIFTVGLPTSTNQVKNSLYTCLQIFSPSGDPVCHPGGDKDQHPKSCYLQYKGLFGKTLSLSPHSF